MLCVFDTNTRGLITVLLGDAVPFSLQPFTVSHLGLCAGIMVTASHNPKQDNGYKVISLCLYPYMKTFYMFNVVQTDGAMTECQTDISPLLLCLCLRCTGRTVPKLLALMTKGSPKPSRKTSSPGLSPGT